jgi:hypothetical protein
VLDRRLIVLVALLVVLDALSTYLCTLYYPVELELNPLLKYLLIKYGRVALALYAPLEFTLLTLLLVAYSRILKKIGVEDTFKYCVVVLSVFYLVIILNFVGVIIALMK